MKKAFLTASLVSALLILSGLIGPVFRSGESVYFSETVEGDVFLAGGEVIVDADIDGDLLVIGGRVDIRGNIEGDVRVIAGQVKLEASVEDDVSLIAGQAENTQQSTIAKSLISIGGMVIDTGKVLGKSYLLGGRVRLNGQSTGPIQVYAQSFEVLPDASIQGELKATYGDKIQISPEAEINGQVIASQSASWNQGDYLSSRHFFRSKAVKQLSFWIIVQQLIDFSMYVVLGWLLILFLPQVVKDLLKLSQDQTSATFAWGLISFLGIPVLAVLLLVSLIGLPLGVLLFVFYGLVLVLAKLLAAAILGSKLLNDLKFKKPTTSFFIGLVVLTLIRLIPILGWMAYSFLMLLGLGAINLKLKTWLKLKLKR